MEMPGVKEGAAAEDRAASGGRGNFDWLRLSHEDEVAVALVDVTRAAGRLALEYFRAGEKTRAAIVRKAGGSPVTEADHATNRYLERELRALLPQAGWLSEESEDSPERLGRDLLLIVDPIDGTRSFAVGERGWAIAVCLVSNQRPVIGVVHAPALGETYVAIKNAGARLNGREIRVGDRAHLGAGSRVAGPVAVADRLRQAGLEFELVPKIPSLALRISSVAAGALDACLVSANSHDWDVAAADLVVEEAGGRLASFDGGALLYNRASTRHGELAAASLPILGEIGAAPRAR